MKNNISYFLNYIKSRFFRSVHCKLLQYTLKLWDINDVLYIFKVLDSGSEDVNSDLLAWLYRLGTQRGPTQLSVSKPSWQHSHGSPKFPNKNLSQIGPGFSTYDRTNKQTDRQTEITTFTLFYTDIIKYILNNKCKANLHAGSKN